MARVRYVVSSRPVRRLAISVGAFGVGLGVLSTIRANWVAGVALAVVSAISLVALKLGTELSSDLAAAEQADVRRRKETRAENRAILAAVRTASAHQKDWIEDLSRRLGIVEATLDVLTSSVPKIDSDIDLLLKHVRKVEQDYIELVRAVRTLSAGYADSDVRQMPRVTHSTLHQDVDDPKQELRFRRIVDSIDLSPGN